MEVSETGAAPRRPYDWAPLGIDARATPTAATSEQPRLPLAALALGTESPNSSSSLATGIMTTVMIDIAHLLELRLVIARLGEMDNARWWNTSGQLGELGVTVLKRNFPRTYRFAAAKSVVAVAKARCNEIFNPPGSMTLWNLPAATEDEFDSRWEGWVEKRDEWEPFFERVATLKGTRNAAAATGSGVA